MHNHAFLVLRLTTKAFYWAYLSRFSYKCASKYTGVPKIMAQF